MLLWNYILQDCIWETGKNYDDDDNNNDDDESQSHNSILYFI